MARHAGYADDFYLWSREQAALLRDLPRSGRDLPNALDIENIAEEIEGVGRSELHYVESMLSNILEHLLKLASLADDVPPLSHWRHEIRTWRRDVRFRYQAGMRQNLNFEVYWRQSQKGANADLNEFSQTVLPIPGECPFTLDDVLAGDTDIDTLVAQLRAASKAPG